jgi:hypothetical protein
LEVTWVTSPVGGANDRLIGQTEKSKAQQTKEKEGPSALPKFILKIIPHQVAERFLMAFINQVKQLRNHSLVWVAHQSLHAGRVGGTPSASIQPTEALAQI